MSLTLFGPKTYWKTLQLSRTSYLDESELGLATPLLQPSNRAWNEWSANSTPMFGAKFGRWRCQLEEFQLRSRATAEESRADRRVDSGATVLGSTASSADIDNRRSVLSAAPAATAPRRVPAKRGPSAAPALLRSVTSVCSPANLTLTQTLSDLCLTPARPAAEQ